MESAEAEPKAHILLTMLDGEDINIPVCTSPFTIGRAKTCDYVIDNRIVSGIHCKLHHDEELGCFFLEDTSTNGMLINKTVRTVKGKKFPLHDGDVVFLIYRKLTKDQKDVISFRFEEVKKIDDESNVLDKTIPYEEEELTEEYHYGNDEDISLQEAEKKRKRDEDEVPPNQEAKKVHLTPEAAPPVSSSAVSSSDDQKEGNKIPKMTDVRVPPDGEPSQEGDKGGGEGILAAEKTGKETEVEGEEESQDEMMETLVCSICQDILHDCVSLQPCMHTFCASCYSQWMAKSSRCPTCRKVAKRACKNHIVNNLVEAYLKAHPNKKRDAEEIAEMDAKNKITSDMVIPSRPLSDEEDYDDENDDDEEDSYSEDSCLFHNRSEEDDFQPQISGGMAFWGIGPNVLCGNWPAPPIMTCRVCPGSTASSNTPSSNSGIQPDASSTTPPTSTAQPSTSGDSASVGATGTSGQNFRIATGNVRVPLPTPPSYVCPPHASHLMCRCCQERFPDRRAEPSQSNIPPISCSMCNMFYCHMYWGCTKNADCYGCLSKFKDMNFGDKCTDLLILGNSQESSIFKKYLQQKKLTWKSVLEECLEKLGQGEFQSLFASLNSISKESIICYPCGLKVFKELAYLYRENIPRDQLPAEATSRPDCYWGKNCRTQFSKPLHAARFNHVCNQTRF